MTINAGSGPFINYGVVLSASGATQEYNEDRAPSLSDLGAGLLDPRTAYAYQPGANGSTSPLGAVAVGFLWQGPLVDTQPATKSSNCIVCSSGTGALVAGGALTLLTSNSSKILNGVSITNALTGAAVTVQAIDWSTAITMASCYGQFVPFAGGRVAAWNPHNMSARALVISPASNTDAGNWVVKGFDVYGYPMTEYFAGGSTTITGQKAWKYITSINNATTVNSTGVGVGTLDAYGMPLQLAPLSNGTVSIWWNTSTQANYVTTHTSQSLIWGSTTGIAQTGSTPDVRGLHFSSGSTTSIVANSSLRLQIWQEVGTNQLASVGSSAIGLFGATAPSQNWAGLFGSPQYGGS